MRVAAEHLPDSTDFLRRDRRGEEAFLCTSQPREGILETFVGNLLLFDGVNQRLQRLRLHLDVAAADQQLVAPGRNRADSRVGNRVRLRDRFHLEIVAEDDTLIAQLVAQQRLQVFDVDLSEGGWQTPSRAQALAAFLRRGRHARLDVIVHDTRFVETSCARLLLLLRQYAHAVTIYRTSGEARKAMDPLVIADGRHFLPDEQHLPWTRKMAGEWRLSISVFYRQALLFVTALKQEDERAFRHLLLALQDRQDFDSAFAEAYGRNPAHAARAFFSTPAGAPAGSKPDDERLRPGR